MQRVAGSLELIFKNDKILRAEADDGMHLAAVLMQLLGDGERDRAADTAADDTDVVQAFKICRNAQRAYKVFNVFALVFAV